MACMDKTPKKIVRSELLCFLSGCTLTKEFERVRMFGKSSVGIQGVIKAAIDISFSFALRFEKILNNLTSLRGDIKRYFERGGF